MPDPDERDSARADVSVPPELVYALVLLSALAHAAWNLLIKASSDSLLMLTAIRTVGVCGGIVVALLVPPPAARSLPWLAAGALVLYVYYVFMLNAYRVGDLSRVYPVSRGLAPLIVLAASAGYALDPVQPSAIAGAVLICVGILALARSGAAGGAPAIVYAGCTGVTIAIYTVLNGIGVRESGSVLGYAAWLEIASGVGVLAYASARRRNRIGAFVRHHWRAGLVAGVLSGAGYVIALWAMTHAPMATVAALRETGVVFAALLGALVLREPFGTRRTLAALVVAAGVGVLGIG